MKRYRTESYMKYVFALSAISLGVPLLYNMGQQQDKNDPAKTETTPSLSDPGGITPAGKAQLLAFCVFEMMVGIFWPSIMTMRAAYVPEELRATIINCFRIPLNLFVCVILYNVHLFPLSTMFGLCAVFLAIAAVCQMRMERIAFVPPVTKGIGI